MVFQPKSYLSEELKRLKEHAVVYTCINDIRHEYGDSYTFSLKPKEVVARMADLGTEATHTEIRIQMLAMVISKNGNNIHIFERKKSGMLNGPTKDWDSFYETYLLRLAELEKKLYDKPLGR